MRIDAYNQISQIYGTTNKAKVNRTQATSGLSDQVSISQAGRDFQVAKKAVSEASDIRETKVAQLKAQVESGTYSVDPEDFASVLLTKYNATL